MEFSDGVVKAAWSRQGGRCAKCGRWLSWPRRVRGGGTGAWEPHHKIPANQGGSDDLDNCVIFCSGVGNCHFIIGHDGVEWGHYASLDDSQLLFLYDGVAAAKAPPELVKRTKRSVIGEVFGIRQSRKAKKRPTQGRKPKSGSRAEART